MRHPTALLSALFLGCLPIVAASPLPAEPVNLLSLQEGTLPVSVPSTYGGWDAQNLLDDSPQSGWACETGKISNNVFVFELVEAASLERFEFDNSSVDTEAAGARDILVEVSTASASSGFAPVLAASLADKTDGQTFPAAARIPARWVRLTIKNNQGSPEYTELFSFRGFGERPALPPPLTISGTYETSYSLFHVRQQGTALSGCYEYKEGLLTGTIEGRVMKITWQEAGEDNAGPAVLVFSPDGASFRGFWWRKGSEQGAPNGDWEGKKIASEVGACPHWSGSVGGELQRQLGSAKRARLYGILFDFNSASLRPESKPVLDELRDLLRAEPSWRVTIEGHTDAVGSDSANQTLSGQRAEAVKAYLVAGGVEAGRLTAAGFGESRPVADNSTELGRAQNRRVELVRQ